MDLSGFAAMSYVCCLGSIIPVTVTGCIYAIVSFFPEAGRPSLLTGKRLPAAIILIFILVFIFTCAFLLYTTRDISVM